MQALDRGRSGQPGRDHGRDRGAPARPPRSPGCGRQVPHRPDRPGHLHAPPRLLGAGLPRGWRRDLPAPHGPPLAPRRTSAGRDTRRLPDPHPRGRAPPGPRGCRDRPPRRPRLDADRRLGGLAVPLARRATATCSVPPTRSSSARSLPLPGIASTEACAVWLAPPADMARPVWRDVLECTQLGPEERAACLALGGPETRRTHRLWGRIAAKEAARRIWRAAGDPARYPADLAVESRRRTAGPDSSTGPGPTIATCRRSRSRTPRVVDRRAGGTRRPAHGRHRRRAGARIARAASRASRLTDGRVRPAGAMAGRVATGMDGTSPCGQAGGRQGDRDRTGAAADRRRGPSRRRPRPATVIVEITDARGSGLMSVDGRHAGVSTSGPGPWVKRS